MKQQNYAINSHVVERILPCVPVEPIIGSPPWFCGLFKLQGEAVPVIDFCLLCNQEPSRSLFSTRIILLRCCDQEGTPRLLGLLAEGVTGTIRYQTALIHRLPLNLIQAPYLAEVITDDKGMIQFIGVDALYSHEVATLLSEKSAREKEAAIVDYP